MPALRSDFLRLYAEMYNGDTAPHAPHYLLYSVWQMSEYFATPDQQDAHGVSQHAFVSNCFVSDIAALNLVPALFGFCVDVYCDRSVAEFLIFVLNQLHNQMQILRPNNPPQTMQPQDVDSTSVIHKVFQGVLRSDVQCCECKRVSTVRP